MGYFFELEVVFNELEWFLGGEIGQKMVSSGFFGSKMAKNGVF